MSKKKTTEEFIEEAKEIHNNKYDYSLVDYKNNATKVKIICHEKEDGIEHGIFKQKPNDHLNRHGCPKCSNIKKKKQAKTTEEFIKEAKLIHSEYDYSLAEYVNNKTKIKIICHKKDEFGKEHGIFEQIPKDHLNGFGCSKCSDKKKLTTEEFIKEAKLIHDEYDYSLVEYKNNSTKVKIICPIHGLFKQTPYQHLNREQGCPNCNTSRGEKIIEKYLKENNIFFEKYKKYKDLKDKQVLSYDFYIPNKNLLIEYNGEQHYKWKKHFQPVYHDFLVQKHHDWLKRKYAKKNNIALLVIPCWEYNDIDKILKKCII